MTEAQAVELLEMVEDLRRMVEIGAWTLSLLLAFTVGGVIHRWARGH